MKIIIEKDYESLSTTAANIIKEEIEKKEDLLLGLATVDLKVTGPANFSLSRSFPISVRAGAQTITTRTVTTIAPGASLNNAPARYGCRELWICLCPHLLLTLDVAYLIKDLMQYPYGCVEQTVSTALPSLYLSQVAASLNLGSDEESRKRVNYAINKLASMQNRDGGFGLWGREDAYSFWLSVYVADFLTRAAEQHYVVPTSMRTSLLTRIAQDVKGGKAADNTVPMAYAFYILAKTKAWWLMTCATLLIPVGSTFPLGWVGRIWRLRLNWWAIRRA